MKDFVYHVLVQRPNDHKPVAANDLTEAELRARVVEPIAAGKTFHIAGVPCQPDQLATYARFRVVRSRRKADYAAELDARFRRAAANGIFATPPNAAFQPFEDDAAEDVTHEVVSAAEDGRESKREETMSKTETTLDVFISHSSTDAKLAEALINLLRSALNLSARRIRCTSVDGYRLPVGTPADKQLRIEVFEARALIGLLTPASTNSTYVMFELGARWGAERYIAPIFAGGKPRDLLEAPLSSLNALDCASDTQMHQLIENLGEELGIEPEAPQVYAGHLAAFVSLAKSEAPAVVAPVSRPASSPLSSLDRTVLFREHVLNGMNESSGGRFVVHLDWSPSGDAVPEAELEQRRQEVMKLEASSKLTVESRGDLVWSVRRKMASPVVVSKSRRGW